MCVQALFGALVSVGSAIVNMPWFVCCVRTRACTVVNGLVCCLWMCLCQDASDVERRVLEALPPHPNIVSLFGHRAGPLTPSFLAALPDAARKHAM